ncbi:MAG: methyltransferase domain-containing protein [Candidatus Korobacteraceae bacterium]|jgi:SAM-dependent methyltransferase
MTSSLSLNRTLKIARTWARVYQYRSLKLSGLAARVAASADLQRIHRLGREMEEVRRRDPTCAAKYTDYSYWMPFNVARIGRLSLHKTSPLRMLDIGCGPGYFLAAARACGHECYGIDAPPSILSDVEKRVYSELLGALGCDAQVSPLLIERYVAMNLPQRDLDLITAFWICFNRHCQPDEWGVAEWRFFVADALSHLREGGTLHLELNVNPGRYGPRQWYDDETLEFFRSVGTVEGGIVQIRKPKARP